jgi:WD40 repeat protein
MLSQHTLRVPHHRLYLFSCFQHSVPYRLLLWLFFLFATAAFAQTPSSELAPTTPFLILNTDMHTSDIKRIDTDAEGQYILTVSTDKTAKLWDAQTGELLHTFRIPIAQGNEGMLYAGAISPDGETVAIAGWTGDAWDDSHCIYILNAVSGTMLQRLTGLPNVINDLEFSPDGKYLAAALATDGLRIYSATDDWRLVKSFTDYRSSSYAAAWDYSGRLATVCYDGKVRLYDRQFNLIAQQSAGSGSDDFLGGPGSSGLAGERPFSLAFSPDGSLLAVGYADSPRLQVLDGTTLKLRYEPDIAGANTPNQSLLTVCFSQDGRYLVAGGYYSKRSGDREWNHIRIWQNQGKGRYTDYPVSKNAIIDLKPLKNNDFLVAGTHPDFARMTYTGKKVFYKEAETHDHRAEDRSHFRTNNQGTVFTVTPFGRTPLMFDVATRTLSTGRTLPNLSSLSGYTDQIAGLTVTDWKSTRSPKINGRDVQFLKKLEICRSTDVASTNKRAILGTDWYLYCADASGSKQWETSLQAVAWAVKISGNDRAVMAALGDGTIRWYRMADGAPLLSLYIHPDGRRWVLWTPQGYYDAAAGAEDLIGWHVNQGKEKEALFYSASRFRSTYYRPDIIDKILETYNEADAIRLANLSSNRTQSTVRLEQALPPIVRILSPTNFTEVSSTTVTLTYQAFSPGGEEIKQVRILIDGRPVETQRALKTVSQGDKNAQTQSITIPPRDVVLQVLAENKFGWSEPATVSLKWKGASVPQGGPDVLKPTLYVLAIGVSDYKNPDYKLTFAAKDAMDFASLIRAQKGGLYKDVVVRTLTNADATKDKILEGLEWIQKETTSRDVAMIFLAGHGINDNTGAFFFMPYEAQTESLRRTCLMFTEFKHTVSTIAGKVVLFVDACHSGNILGGRRAAPNIDMLVHEMASVESGAVVFTSSTGRQYSLEDERWGNGAFTKALLEGLQGEADWFRNGTITVKTLDAYIARRVKTLTQGQQAPTCSVPPNMPDFPLAIKLQ